MKSSAATAAVAFVSLALVGAVAHGSIIISAGATNYTTNFDSMGSSATATLPTGFRVGSGASPTYATGTSATTAAAGTTGTGALTGTSSGGIYNFADGVTATSTDRSLGFLTTGSFSSPRSIMASLTNSTSSAITALSLAWNYEKYRTGTRAFNYTFYVSTDGSTWTANTAGDQAYGADASNAVVNPATSISKSVSLSGLSIAPTSQYYLRWDYAGVGGATNAQGLAVDDFTVSATLNASPAFGSAGYSTTVDLGDRSSSVGGSVAVAVADADASQTLTLTSSSLPVGFSGGAFSPSTFSTPVTLGAGLSTFGFTVAPSVANGTYPVQFTVSDGIASSVVTVNLTVVPEPASLALLGGASLLVMRRRR